MTVYGWDASNYDSGRGPMDLAAARAAGISLFTHKVSEGLYAYRDMHSAEAQRRAMAAGFPVLGGYHVLHPGDMGNVAQQADWYLDCITADNPNWSKHPCFIHQIDAEKFDYMTRAPNVAEINAYGDRIVARTGCSPSLVLAYAPSWLYGGNSLAGLKYRLWASSYGANPVAGFKAAYPGDHAGGWNDYSGMTPLVLQYGSQTTIGSQQICDANAVRVNSDAELVALFKGDDMPLTDADVAKIWAYGIAGYKAGDRLKAISDDAAANVAALKAAIAKVGITVTDAQAQVIADAVAAKMPSASGFVVQSTITPKTGA